MGGAKVYQADDRVGAFPPLGYWDPWGLSTEVTDGQLAYIREAELKHGRICMLAAVGIFIAEKWHPLFGGDIDVPALQIVNPGTRVTLQTTGVTLQETRQSSSLGSNQE